MKDCDGRFGDGKVVAFVDDDDVIASKTAKNSRIICRVVSRVLFRQ
jgi:hypothetical protein